LDYAPNVRVLSNDKKATTRGERTRAR